MKTTQKMALLYAIALILSISFAIQLAHADERDDDTRMTALTEEQLDNVLAPIALYPDTLLTHVLIASTYPLDVIRAARWRQANLDLDHEQVVRKVDQFDWEPSIKALAPFNDVLQQMSNDIDWLNYLGDSVIADEEWVLSRIQFLRKQAYAQGSLDNNDYIQIEQEDDVIVIETVRDRVVYVPFYDTRVVYGPWWHYRSPYYWDHPQHYRYHRSGFYWSPSVHIAAHFFFGGFHWHHGYVVVNHHNHRPYYRSHKRVYSKEYQRWAHNTQRRQARYHQRVVKHQQTRHSRAEPVVTINREHKVKKYGDYQHTTPVSVSTQRSITKVKKAPTLGKERELGPRHHVAPRNTVNKNIRRSDVVKQPTKASRPSPTVKVDKQVKTSHKTVRSSTKSISRQHTSKPRKVTKVRRDKQK